MQEYYARYRRAPKKASTGMIDHPIIFLKGFTKAELMSGVLLFVISIYVSAFSILLTLLVALGAYGAPFLLRQLRLNMPPNIWCHWLWFHDLWNAPLPSVFHRPRCSFLIPSGDVLP